jgi:hypothetical protein
LILQYVILSMRNSYRFKTTSHRLRYIGRISGARCDLDGL